MFSITSICLNGSNWAQVVEVFLLGRKKFDYVIKEPPVPTDPKFADWRAEDAQIRSCLWNNMESKINYYYNKFKGVCEELNIYQPISFDVKIMKKQRDSTHVARFLSRLPKSLNPVKSQILASPILPSLREVFGRLRQATLSDSSIDPFSSSHTNALPSGDKSAFTTYMGSNRGGRGGRGCGGRGRRGREQGGRGKGRGLCKCTYCH
ncbi:hypothetical protein RGQ29_032077, partial [Quercus rubra]